jgi:hypothetical protein
MIKLKNILAENMLRFGTKNLNESEKHRLIESGSTEPGDPSQSTVDLSTEFSALNTALKTYNQQFDSIVGVDPGLFLRQSTKVPGDLLFTSNQIQRLMSGNGYVLKYNIPTKKLSRYTPEYTYKTDNGGIGKAEAHVYNFSKLDANNIGVSRSVGIWRHPIIGGVNFKKEKQTEKVKAAAITVGQAIFDFLNAFTTKNVPSNYVPIKMQNFADGTSEFILGTPEQ